MVHSQDPTDSLCLQETAVDGTRYSLSRQREAGPGAVSKIFDCAEKPRFCGGLPFCRSFSKGRWTGERIGPAALNR